MTEVPKSLRSKALPFFFLFIAYAILGLTLSEHLTHAQIMQRCVLVDPVLSRIWSVAHIEIGMAYTGIFLSMAWYVARAGRRDRIHLRDLCIGFTYLFLSFLLDYICVRYFQPFEALLIGDAIVMTFTAIISRQLWFQRLLGVFIPMVFLTCGVGHLLEGLSYWKLTYPVNVPWTMVTADIGFAILVNAYRFPSFIRGGEIVDELAEAKKQLASKQKFFGDVLNSVTDGKLTLHTSIETFPDCLEKVFEMSITDRNAMREVRVKITEFALSAGYEETKCQKLETCAGEAMMNAVVHGKNGCIRVCANQDSIQIWVIDNGNGINLGDLPRATLKKGWSSKNTMGMGYTLILAEADKVDLMTGPEGTTVLIIVSREETDNEIPALLLRELNAAADFIEGEKNP